MLKLIYDVKCGFEEVYVVEKDVEEDLTYWINTTNESMLEAAAEIQKEDPEYKPEPYTEEELYEQYKDNPKELIEEVFSGMYDCIAECTVLKFAKTYFKHICYADPKKPFVPGQFKMMNLRLVLEDKSGKRTLDRNTSLKASEVMALLGISRPTLCHYVKKGLITIDSNYTGKQYRYNKDSVMALLNK
ncbi:helix-turn-helix domain-containing protein [Intestinibacter sp.]|uniref:helix-turn-helix domain-containing protein n=1 Tax=Intestinibacter sp. TaxID=1965304 RepID=UPI002A756195|nr:helix-turn-helix domain-containing protein [Intestinibacter sp.]MDY2735908.1 helix-turn-helix domain-containing protein [Intestinibacter sp.]